MAYDCICYNITYLLYRNIKNYIKLILKDNNYITKIINLKETLIYANIFVTGTLTLYDNKPIPNDLDR